MPSPKRLLEEAVTQDACSILQNPYKCKISFNILNLNLKHVLDDPGGILGALESEIWNFKKFKISQLMLAGPRVFVGVF